MFSLETNQRKWASSRLEGRTSWIISSLAGALDLGRGPQGPALVASGKASPHRVAREHLWIPLLSMPGSKTLCGVGAGIDGRGIPRGRLATGMGTGISSIRAGP